MNEREKKKNHLLVLGLCLLLIVCIVLSVLLVKRNQKLKDLETVFMKDVYMEIWNNLSNPLGNSSAYENPQYMIDNVTKSLGNVDRMLEKGHTFLSKDVPSGAYCYFWDMRAEIDKEAFIREDGKLSSQGEAYMKRLSDDMRYLLSLLQGEDKLNFNRDLTMKEFKAAFDTLIEERYIPPF